jgi:hypothetical protein
MSFCNHQFPTRSTQTYNRLSQDAYNEIVDALSRDMPLIMHGSGDVLETNPQSQLLLSRLTADYISNLVEAAVDAHEILNGGKRPPLPPPPPPCCRKRKEPPLPAPYIWPTDIHTTTTTTTTTTATSTTSKSAASSKKKPPTPKNLESSSTSKSDPNLKGRRTRVVDYWDEPLPDPKIKNKPPPKQQEKTALQQTLPEDEEEEMVPLEKEVDGVKIGDWVGVAGVDFFPDSRARSVHVAMPAAIGTQCFLFPVCHDAGLYGKVLDIQSAKRSMAPLFANATIRDVLRNESGALRKRRREAKRKPKGHGNGDNEDDDLEDDEAEATDSEEEEDAGAAVWPGLEKLLPVHTTKDFIDTMM